MGSVLSWLMQIIREANKREGKASLWTNLVRWGGILLRNADHDGERLCEDVADTGNALRQDIERRQRDVNREW